MNDFEVIDKLCAVISEQAEIIRKQALLLELVQADSGELMEQRAAIDAQTSEILKES